MSQLKVFKASAGSGKTYTLTGEYIKLLFKSPYDYSQILAVTFTNKATSEMRLRILTTLNNLANYSIGNIEKPDYLDDLKKEFTLTEAQIKSRAFKLLRLLLHDFSRFSISTIDSFFQTVTRSFAREMGLPVGFRLELNPNEVMMQAIDQLILEMDEPHHKELKQWLIEFARERMEQDKGWNIATEISKISQEIFKEKFQANAPRLAKQIGDRNFLSTYKKALAEIVTNIDNRIKSIGEEGLSIIEKYELDINNDFSGRSRTPVKVFKNMAEINDHLNLTKIEKLLIGIDNWTRKDNSSEKNLAIELAYNSGLHQLLLKAAEIIINESRNYYTSRLIIPNLHALGMLNDVNIKMMQLCREQNIFLISGTNYLLTRIINNNETPFIYEKTGTRYKHYMMDEFQDTSSLQYLNFLPLVNDSLAGGNYALMVGDVKQAIYRWRNSDWNLLAEQVESDFAKYGLDARTLETNYRSNEEVIRFNNDFFKTASSIIQNQFNTKVPEDLKEKPEVAKMQHKIETAYNDITQKTSSNKENSGGQIFIKFLEAEKSEEFIEASLQESINRIYELTQTGVKLSDICILVRKNQEAVVITNALLSGEYHPTGQTLPVISNESLVIGNSEAIRLIISQLKYIQNPHDKVIESYIRIHITRLTAEKTSQEDLDLTTAINGTPEKSQWEKYKIKLKTLQEKPLYELTEELIKLLPQSLINIQGTYLQAFMSQILSFITQESADLNRYIDYWESVGHKKSLTVTDNQEAIRVMTIHKSKGLEFKAVIVPFANWPLVNLSHTDIMWIEPKTEPFNAVSLVPVKGLKALGDSHFAEEYLDEILHQYVDNLNVTYVAFTRARESLSIIGTLKPPKEKKTSNENDEIKNVSQLLFEYINSSNCSKNISDAWDLENKTLVINSENKSLRTEKKASTAKNSKRPEESKPCAIFTITGKETRLENYLESEDYFKKDAEGEKINYGKIMHYLFENIITSCDLDKALTSLRFKGMISLKESEQLKPEVEKWMSNPETSSWFDGTYLVKTEAGILARYNKRPDRVMIKEDEVIVVDYKFGNHKQPEHQKQVQEYMHLIKKMGYKKVTGKLWYAEINEIVEVNDQGQLF